MIGYLVENELERIWKVAPMVLLPQNLPGVTEEKHKSLS
jgi:hypothetical protein